MVTAGVIVNGTSQLDGDHNPAAEAPSAEELHIESEVQVLTKAREFCTAYGEHNTT